MVLSPDGSKELYEIDKNLFKTMRLQYFSTDDFLCYDGFSDIIEKEYMSHTDWVISIESLLSPASVKMREKGFDYEKYDQLDLRQYLHYMLVDFQELQKQIKDRSKDTNIKYIIWISHLVYKLKKIWFHIYDINKKDKTEAWKMYFTYPKLKQHVYKCKWLIYSLLAEANIFDCDKRQQHKLKGNIYLNESKDIKTVNKRYSTENIKLAIISVEDFLSIDFSKYL